MIHGVNDAQVGRAFRAVRIRKGWRQEDVAREAGVSQQTVSRIERGLLDRLPPGTLRRVASALGIRVTIEARWDGAELDRLLGARHSAMHDEVVRRLGGLPEWLTAPEVTFSVYGERGAIDILAWHAGTRTLLVIELKTELVDVQETLGTLDRKVRLAARIAAERGWNPDVVSSWLVIAESATNRRPVAAHRTVLRAALPADGRTIRGWLREPRGAIHALSFLASTQRAGRALAARVQAQPEAAGSHAPGEWMIAPAPACPGCTHPVSVCTMEHPFCGQPPHGRGEGREHGGRLAGDGGRATPDRGPAAAGGGCQRNPANNNILRCDPPSDHYMLWFRA